ncbi:hypothetical protein QR680_015312 [Steinernema hermaphroditum]|uniref:Uncharacterized protein n=1 Tax=Steinernema hermaphroditum TaxID=289476 RepID=A0AA39H795_9BILA|nr:hypothetical protein QR680_015312 [Steinernema hermaphroditum]
MSPDDLNKFLSYLFTGLSYSVAIPFFYIVIFKSPPSVRVYRNTILNLGIWYSISMGSYAILFQPIYATLPNRSCVRFAGLVSYFGREFHVAVMVLTVVSIENVLVAMIICFFYRYDQLRSINNVSFLKTYKGVIICVAMQIAISIFAGSLTYAFLLIGEIVEHNGALLFCTNINNYRMVKLMAFIVGVSLICECLASVALAIMTIIRLRSLKTHMTEWTIQLQQRLTINLVVLLFLPIVFDVIPICILCYMAYIKSDSLYFWVSFTGHAPFGDVILSFLATLYFVTPYRKAVKIFWKKNVIGFSSNTL